MAAAGGQEKSFAELVATLRSDSRTYSPSASPLAAPEPLPPQAAAFDADGNGMLDASEVSAMLASLASPQRAPAPQPAAALTPAPQLAATDTSRTEDALVYRGGLADSTVDPGSHAVAMEPAIASAAMQSGEPESLSSLQQRILAGPGLSPSVPSPLPGGSRPAEFPPHVSPPSDIDVRTPAIFTTP